MIKHSSHLICALFVVAIGVIRADDPAAPGGTSSGDIVNVRDFGAVGDGTTDDTAALTQAAAAVGKLLDKAPLHSAQLYFPAGIYPVTQRIEIIGHAATPGDAGLKISGEDMLSTRLISKNADGILSVTLNNISTQVQVSELGFFAAQPDAGVALEIKMPEKGIVDHRAAIVRDLTIGGIDHTKDFFDKAVSLIGTARPLISNVLATGPYGHNITGDTGIGFSLFDTYSPTIVDSCAWSFEKGCYITAPKDHRLEGVFINRSKFVNVDYGVEVDLPGIRLPEGMISENHINARVVGLTLRGKKFVTVSENLFYNQNPPGKPYTDILLDNAEKVMLLHNIFHFPGGDDRIGIELKNSRENTITGNMFNAPGIGIKVDQDVMGTQILDNRFFHWDLILKVPLNKETIEDHGTGTVIRALADETQSSDSASP